MNTTSTTIVSLSEHYYALFVNPVIVIRFYQIGYPITFLLGFIGNLASLVTFSRTTLRKVSTGCLFILLAVSDTFYLLMCIFDFVEFGLQVIFFLCFYVSFSYHRYIFILIFDIMNFVDFVHLSCMSRKHYLHGY
jgi:hypothetical protein